MFPIFQGSDFPASYLSLPEILPRYDNCVLTISNYLMAFSDLPPVGFGGVVDRWRKVTDKNQMGVATWTLKGGWNLYIGCKHPVIQIIWFIPSWILQTILYWPLTNSPCWGIAIIGTIQSIGGKETFGWCGCDWVGWNFMPWLGMKSHMTWENHLESFRSDFF